MKYTTLLLDLDETLFDFSKSEKFAIDKLMEKYNIPVTEENRRLYSKINDEKWKKLERGELTRPQLFRERFGDFLKNRCDGGHGRSKSLLYAISVAGEFYSRRRA